MEENIKLSVAKWKYCKDWVYSITYDEALADLSKFVIPVHDELGIPGHVEVVAGQIGKRRNCGTSSFNGMRHMNSEELRELVSKGWGVGNHSWSHENVMNNPELELLKAKEVIEDAIGRPVTVYTAPGNNDNLTSDVIEKLKEYGYLAGMSITDDVNFPDADDLFWINRVPLHEKYWGVFDGTYDPWKRIHQARALNSWIVDYCHCPLEQAIHLYKDCNAAHHRERLETIIYEGGNSCWYANPDEVIDYRYMRRCAFIENINIKEGHFCVNLNSVPKQVYCKELTILIECPFTPEVINVFADGNQVKVYPVKNGILCFTIEVHNGMEIAVQKKSYV
ncbi:MAG: polysaccharide deacetylase family protein [Firmicutes bacterium]|nr:polysaccharide deacetylase family protein [Bacillota bacterium]